MQVHEAIGRINFHLSVEPTVVSFSVSAGEIVSNLQILFQRHHLIMPGTPRIAYLLIHLKQMTGNLNLVGIILGLISHSPCHILSLYPTYEEVTDLTHIPGKGIIQQPGY